MVGLDRIIISRHHSITQLIQTIFREISGTAPVRYRAGGIQIAQIAERGSGETVFYHPDRKNGLLSAMAARALRQ
jgi:hypothetical protein